MSQISTTAPLRPDYDWQPGTPTAFATMHTEWFAEAHRAGDDVVISVSALDPQRALAELVDSDDALDREFVAIVRSLTGHEMTALFAHADSPRSVHH